MSWGLNYIFGIGDTDAWGDYDGEIIALKYSQTKSNFKDYLTFANKCWEAGIIDPDAFSLNASTAGDRNDQYGASVKFPGYLEVTDQAGLEVFVPGVVAKEGDSYGFPNFNTGVWCYWAISSSCEHPEKVMEFFNSAIEVLQTLVVALGAGLGVWGAINLLEGYGNDNPGSNAHVR